MSKTLVALILLGLLGAGVLLFIGQKNTQDKLSSAQNARSNSPKSQSVKVGKPVEFNLKLPEGFKIGIFAEGLDNPRDLAISEGGTLLVSIPSRGKVVALPDRDNDGVADEVKEVLVSQQRPHGLVFNKGKLFVAEETQVSSYDWDEQKVEALNRKKVFSLPKGDRHFTRTIDFDSQGRMYVSVGSTCDVCFEGDPFLAAVVSLEPGRVTPRVFAKGLRNATFIKVKPDTGELWVTEMGRDFLGDNKPPDEINIVREGGDYGWPICFGNKTHDNEFDKKVYIRDPCEDTEAPVYEIQAHSAPLGLNFINSSQFPKDSQGDLLVAYHGSWNSTEKVGYKIVKLDLEGSKVVKEEDFITGFLKAEEVLGRPVDLEFDQQGSLYISDDKKGTVYKVIKQ
ncbi:PQQ-dependent sugar dehydrogenase [Candidatus Daviesbacteria bacterium]|nr:PQQ-dependent sugar dehydrogenase [Candidatus Daviesbacteria bacterium]